MNTNNVFRMNIKGLLLLSVLPLMQACTTNQFSSEVNVHSPSPEVILVNRTQTQKEIDALYERYNSADASKLPRGLKAIMRQMVTIPADSPMSSKSSVKVASLSKSSDEETTIQDVDNGDEYFFAKRKPTLPLSGGFLNNRGTTFAGIKKPETKPNYSKEPIFAEDARGRLIRKEQAKSPVTQGINKAKKVTGKLIESANEAISTASEALDKGFAALKQKVESTDDPNKDIESINQHPITPKELATVVEPNTTIPEPKKAQSDVSEDISTAKKDFLSRFNRSSYSVAHEGVLIVALVIGFLLVTWIRLEYEQANTKR